MRRSIAVVVLAIVGLIGCSGASHSGRPDATKAIQATSHDTKSSLATIQQQPRRRSIDVDGVKLSILEAGTGDPVIFVHGVVTTSNIFPKYLNAYSPDFRGIAVDLRGYGDSDKPDTGFTIDQFSKDLIKLTDALHIEKPVWVGVSMGGMILQRLALDNPSRVKALVLVSTTDGAMILDHHIPSIGAPRDYREVSKNMIVESFPPGTDAQIYQPLLDRIPTWNATVIRQALTSMSQFNVHGQLSQIRVPTLIMVGAKDDVATSVIARGIQEQIPGAQVKEFNTGHFMMAEDPNGFLHVLGEFLRGLKSIAPTSTGRTAP
jgi:3-oxoadipate enol-lactonase